MISTLIANDKFWKGKSIVSGMDRKIRKNRTLSVMQISLRTIAALCASGTLMQTFLAYIGFAESNIYLHATLVSAVNLTTTLLFSHFADSRSVLLRSACVQIPNGLLFLCLLPFCFGVDATPSAFMFLMGVSLAQAVFTALNTVCEYKLPYQLYRAIDYGPVQALSGILSSVITFAVGILIDRLKEMMPFNRLMLYAFIVSFAMMAFSGVLSLCLSLITTEERDGQKEHQIGEKKKVSTLTIFKTPVFYLLIPANLMRGIAAGCINVLATVAVALEFRDIAPLMVSIAAVANLLACFIFGIVCRYVTPRISIFVGSLCFLLLPLGLVSPSLFLVMYAVVFFGRSIVDVSVPTLLICAVDADIAGPYNAWRLILNTGGMMIATTFAALPFVTPAILLWSALICSVVSGTFFYFLPLLRRASPFFIHGRPHLLAMHKKD